MTKKKQDIIRELEEMEEYFLGTFQEAGMWCSSFFLDPEHPDFPTFVDDVQVVDTQKCGKSRLNRAFAEHKHRVCNSVAGAENVANPV